MCETNPGFYARNNCRVTMQEATEKAGGKPLTTGKICFPAWKTWEGIIFLKATVAVLRGFQVDGNSRRNGRFPGA